MRKLLVLLLIAPAAAFGWGQTGHRTVCTIAEDLLTSEARVELDRLIDLDPQYDTFAESCLYADGPPRIRTPDHFLNVPRSYRAIAKNECPMAETCVLKAVATDAGILADRSRSATERLEALKLLGHWVGDLHQPMHISFQDDLGANLVNLAGEENEGNLHGAWDYLIIAREFGEDHLQIAADLAADISPGDRADWMFDSPVEWVNESFQITISRSARYCVQQQGACWYDRENMMLNQGETQKEVAVSRRYIARHKKTVELRLKQAGVRLAVLLEAALVPEIAASGSDTRD